MKEKDRLLDDQSQTLSPSKISFHVGLVQSLPLSLYIPHLRTKKAGEQW